MVEWDAGVNGGYDSVAYRKQLEEAARKPGKVVRDSGDAAALFAKGGISSRPSTTCRTWPRRRWNRRSPPPGTSDGACEVWAPTQAPQVTRERIAERLKLPFDKVTVNVTLLGGGFGRKSKPDFVLEAAILAKAFRSPPARSGPARTTCISPISTRSRWSAGRAWRRRAAAGLAASLGGAEHHRTVRPGQQAPGRLRTGHGPDQPAVRHPQRAPGEPRGPGAHPGRLVPLGLQHPHAFAIQSFVGELAAKAGQDPKDYLLLLGPARRIDTAELGDSWNYGESPERYPLDVGRLRG